MTGNESLTPHIVKGYIQPSATQTETTAHSRVDQKRLTTNRKIDHRNGLHNLKQIILKLRQFYRDDDEIPRVDLIDAINDFCGLDARTERKYERLLLRRHYLEPAGRRHQETTRVNVRTFSQIDGSPNNNLKEYVSNRGYGSYKFGLFAPKQTEQSPLLNPPSTFNEGSINIKNMCASQRVGEGGQTEREKDGSVKDRKKKKILSHTHIIQHSVNTFEQKYGQEIDRNVSKLSAEEVRILGAAKGGS